MDSSAREICAERAQLESGTPSPSNLKGAAEKESRCVHCLGENPDYRCTQCLKVWYCSWDCQKAHWKTHKKTCFFGDPQEVLDAGARMQASVQGLSSSVGGRSRGRPPHQFLPAARAAQEAGVTKGARVQSFYESSTGEKSNTSFEGTVKSQANAGGGSRVVIEFDFGEILTVPLDFLVSVNGKVLERPKETWEMTVEELAEQSDREMERKELERRTILLDLGKKVQRRIKKKHEKTELEKRKEHLEKVRQEEETRRAQEEERRRKEDEERRKREREESKKRQEEEAVRREAERTRQEELKRRRKIAEEKRAIEEAEEQKRRAAEEQKRKKAEEAQRERERREDEALQEMIERSEEKKRKSVGFRDEKEEGNAGSAPGAASSPTKKAEDEKGKWMRQKQLEMEQKRKEIEEVTLRRQQEALKKRQELEAEMRGGGGAKSGDEAEVSNAKNASSSKSAAASSSSELRKKRVAEDGKSGSAAPVEESEDEEEDQDHDKLMDELIEQLRSQIRAQGEKKEDPEATEEGEREGETVEDASRSADTARTLEMIEAARLAELLGDSKKRQKNINRRADRDYIFGKLKAQAEEEARKPRYLNNKEIWTKGGRRDVDVRKLEEREGRLGEGDAVNMGEKVKYTREERIERRQLGTNF